MSILCLFAGCSTEKISTEKLRDIEFTVVPNKDIPEEKRIKLAFAVGDNVEIFAGLFE